MKLTKMNLYRLWRMPSTYIIAGAILLFCCFAFTIMFSNGQATSEFANIEYNLSSYYEYFVSGDITALFITIISAIFVSSEITSGSIKNIYGKETHKYKLVLSKVMAMFTFSILILAELFIASIMFNLIHDKKLSLGTEIVDLLKYSSLHLILLTAFSSIIICIGTISRNNVITLVIGIIYCTWGYSIETFIDTKLQKIDFLSDITLSLYTIMGNLKTITLSSHSDDYLRAIITSIVIILLTSLASHYYLKNSDVK